MSGVNKISEALSAKMANMSFACACMIVLFHATPAPQTGSFAWWICHLLGREGICMIAVPWFFLSSGFFLAGHLGECEGWWKHEVVKRIRSLVIPFYIWMVVAVLFGITIWYMKVHVFHMQVKSSPFSLSPEMFILKISGLHPVEDIGVLWYLRCLFGLVLISPILYWLLRWKWVILATFTFFSLVVSWYFFNGGSEGFYFLFDRFISLRGLMYFFLGLILRAYQQLLLIDRKVASCSFALGVVLLVVDNRILLSGDVRWIGLFEAITVPFLLIGVLGLMTTRRSPKWLAGNSFPVFLMHNIFLSISSLGFKALGMYGDARYDLVMMFSRAFVAIVASVMISICIHRFFPRTSAIIFGGR